MEERSNTIKIEHVSKQFRSETVVKDVSVELEGGNIYGIVGKNGSGKTVLLKMIAGYLHPASGAVYVGKQRIGDDIDFPRNMGLIIETPGFLSQYSGYDNLKYLADIRGVIGKDGIWKAMERVGLDSKSHKKVGKYSLGMRQRLGIAQAIMEDPDILLLDEPMNGLDQKGIEEIRELLQELRQEGKLIIITSHYKEDVEICDKVFQMNNGELFLLAEKSSANGENDKELQ